MGKKSGGKVRVKQLGPKGGGMPINPLADLAIPPEEQIMIPVKPPSDAGYLFWPMSETMTMNYSRFPAIYPNYLDSNKTIKMGRRISAKDGVPEPTCIDIHEALASMNIQHVVQPYKGYSRDAESRWDNLGRILVDLKGAEDNGLLQMGVDGTFDLDNIPDLDMSDENDSGNGGTGKKKLLKELARVIKTLPGRQTRLEQKNRLLEEEKAKAAKAEKEAAAKTKTAPSSGAVSGGNRKKKGKKKK